MLIVIYGTSTIAGQNHINVSKTILLQMSTASILQEEYGGVYEPCFEQRGSNAETWLVASDEGRSI